MKRPLIIGLVAIVGLVLSVIVSTVFLNWLSVDVLGWDSDGYLGFYLMMWFPMIGLLEAAVVILAWKFTRGRDFG